MAYRGECTAYFSVANSFHFRYSLFGIYRERRRWGDPERPATRKQPLAISLWPLALFLSCFLREERSSLFFAAFTPAGKKCIQNKPLAISRWQLVKPVTGRRPIRQAQGRLRAHSSDQNRRRGRLRSTISSIFKKSAATQPGGFFIGENMTKEQVIAAIK